MFQIVINTLLSTLTGAIIGYCAKIVKDHKEKTRKEKENENLQNTALMNLLKNNLTSTYFIYNELKQIPDYVYQSFLDMLEVYEKLGGDGFIHTIAGKTEKWDIVKTDIL